MMSIITSGEATTLQDFHIDYYNLVGWEKRPAYVPLAFIIALEDNVALLVEGQRVEIPRGFCFIFKGDLGHQGLPGHMGARLHGFIGTRFHPASMD
jgi:hypothetical protein